MSEHEQCRACPTGMAGVVGVSAWAAAPERVAAQNYLIVLQVLGPAVPLCSCSLLPAQMFYTCPSPCAIDSSLRGAFLPMPRISSPALCSEVLSK